MRKRFLSVLLTLCMVLTLLPTAAFAAETLTADAIVTAMGGSTGQAGPKLHDTRNELEPDDDSAIADDALYTADSYKVTAAANTKTDDADQDINVTVVVTGLKYHQNGDTPETMGYWVGVTYPAISGWTITGYKRDDQTSTAAIAEGDRQADGSLNAYYNKSVGTSRPVWVTYTNDTDNTETTIKFLLDLTGVQTAEDKITITNVEATIDTTTKVNVGGTLPVAEITKAEASGLIKEADSILDITTVWKNSNGDTVTTAATAGDYSYTVTVALKESAKDNYTLAADAFTTMTNTLTVEAAPPAAPVVTFGKVVLDGEETLYGKTPDEMGAFTIEVDETDAKKIIVTGSANYISEYVEFSSDADEQNGYYLPINIKLDKAASVTITGTKTTTVEVTLDDPDIQLVMRLDDIVALNTEAKNTFTVAVGDDTYTVDVSGVALLPEVKVDEDVSGATKVEADESLSNLIENPPEDPAEDAPVKVEVNDSTGDKTLTFDGTVNSDPTTGNKGHTVELPSSLVSAMGTSGGDSEANVKVNSGVGSVTIPSAALSGVSNNVTVSIKAADGSSVTSPTIKNDEGNSLDASDIATITSAISSATNGVSVVAKDGSNNLIADGNTDKIIEIVISGLTPNSTYTVLCVDGSNVTSFGEHEAEGDGTITVKTTHLTEWYPIASSDPATKAVLDKVAADPGIVSDEETPTPPDPAITLSDFTADSASLGYKATLSGLTVNDKYTVQICRAANTAPSVVYTFTATAATQDISVNTGCTVTVWEGELTFTNGNPDNNLPSVTKTAP